VIHRKYRKRKLLVFVEKMRRGFHIEYRETKEIPLYMQQGDYKKAIFQVFDIVKMGGLVVLWVVPGGSVIVAVMLKVSKHVKPSAFQHKKENRWQ
jgi:hypothetical protein